MKKLNSAIQFRDTFIWRCKKIYTDTLHHEFQGSRYTHFTIRRFNISIKISRPNALSSHFIYVYSKHKKAISARTGTESRRAGSGTGMHHKRIVSFPISPLFIKAGPLVPRPAPGIKVSSRPPLAPRRAYTKMKYEFYIKPAKQPARHVLFKGPRVGRPWPRVRHLRTH